MIPPSGRQLWLCRSLFLFLHPQQSTECLWRECVRRRRACCCSSSRWKHLGCCVEAGQDECVGLIDRWPTLRHALWNMYASYIYSALRVLRLYLISEETELLQEVQHQLEFVSDCVFLHLSPDLLGLLAHVVLQEERWWVMMIHTYRERLHLTHIQVSCTHAHIVVWSVSLFKLTNYMSGFSSKYEACFSSKKLIADTVTIW